MSDRGGGAGRADARGSDGAPAPERSARPRQRGGRPLSALLPGAPQLAAGRWGAGTTALAAWLGLLWICFARTDRLVPAASGPLDGRLAVATVAAGLVASWLWSWRDVRRPEAADRPGASQWGLAARAFSRNRAAVAGLIVIVALYVLALVTPLVAPHGPAVQGDLLADRLQPPSSAHLLGTDQFARDIFSRLLYGARISLSIGFISVGISVTIGTLVGAVAGYLGGVVDGIIMRFVDMVLAFPRLVLLVTIIAVYEASIFLIIAVLGLTLWPSTARIVRGEVLGLREREFVQAARALGYSKRRIVFRHLIPNTLAPVIVAATLGIGNTIVLEAGLSFLGLGVQPPTPSWGVMVANGQRHLLDAWWYATAPGLAIVFTVLSFNLVGDGLRDALDPRIRR